MKPYNITCKAKHVLGAILLLIPTVISFYYGVQKMGLEHTLTSFSFTLGIVLIFFVGWILLTSRDR